MDEFGDVGGESFESFDESSIEFSETDFPDMPDESFNGIEAGFDETGAFEDPSSEMAYAEVSENPIPEEEFPDMPDETLEEGGVLVDGTEGTSDEFPDYEMPDMEQASDSTEAFPGRVYNAFEQDVMSENPEFYATGRFYQQGINEYGYEGTCGPTSQANALNELFDTNVFTENNILTTAVENSLCETSSENSEDCGGTNTDQFMNLYEKVSEQTDGAFDAKLYEYENVLDANQVADRLDRGDVVNVAVDSSVLWDQPRNTFDPLGVLQENEGYSDHWITVSGVQRDASGEIVGFDIIDSGGGESSVSLDKYNEMCFGSEEYKVLDPTCIVVSKNKETSS